MITHRFEHLFLGERWLSPGYLTIADDGMIDAVSDLPTDRVSEETHDGFALPGMGNLHSHSFHRALAGFTEPHGGAAGDHSAWRVAMYRLAEVLTPDQIEAIASQAFLEMARAGYTAVAEFHYLHHAPGGARYANRAETSERIIRAADRVGVGLTLLPTLYMHGGIDMPLTSAQTRFGSSSVDDFAELLRAAKRAIGAGPMRKLGAAVHSLRAVTGGEVGAAVARIDDLLPGCPIHIHLAEQRGEVEESVAKLGQRPWDWLASSTAVDARWTLVHATQCDPSELADIARVGATVGLAPLTEANLGDGVFAYDAFERAGGRWGIGTDSNISIGLASELQSLEYGQRQVRQVRAVHVGAGRPGPVLYEAALRGGAAALGQPLGALERGRRADIIRFDANSPLSAHGTETFLDGWVMSAAAIAPDDVMVGGKWIIRDGRHVHEDEIVGGYRSALAAVRER